MNYLPFVDRSSSRHFQVIREFFSDMTVTICVSCDLLCGWISCSLVYEVSGSEVTLVYAPIQYINSYHHNNTT